MTDSQINSLQSGIGLTIPNAYRAYLRIAGNSPPMNLVGSDCYGHYLPKLRGWANEILASHETPFHLEDFALVFLIHQGYQFFYFIADGENDDPSVYYYHEDADSPTHAYATFTDWLRVVALSLDDAP